MQKYKIERKIGEGAFSNVFLATHIQSDLPYAIKVHKSSVIETDNSSDIREVALLKRIKHQSIIRLHETFTDDLNLYIVLEYMEGNLFERYLSQNRGPIQEKTIKNVILRIAQALEVIHEAGFFHRDLKPQNILITGDEVKLADFGLARGYVTKNALTDYVSTRWYRAPELVIRMMRYSTPVDIFALGCIMAEMYNGRPLFPGNSEKQQLSLILNRIDLPEVSEWPEFYHWCRKKGVTLMDNVRSKTRQKPIIQRSQKVSPLAEDLVRMMLDFNPSERITAKEILNHPYFRSDSQNEGSESSNEKTPSFFNYVERKINPQNKSYAKSKNRNIRVMARNDEPINMEYFDNFIKAKDLHEQNTHLPINPQNTKVQPKKSHRKKKLYQISSEKNLRFSKLSKEKSREDRSEERKSVERRSIKNRDLFRKRMKSGDLKTMNFHVYHEKNRISGLSGGKMSLNQMLRSSRSKSEKKRSFSRLNQNNSFQKRMKASHSKQKTPEKNIFHSEKNLKNIKTSSTSHMMNDSNQNSWIGNSAKILLTPQKKNSHADLNVRKFVNEYMPFRKKNQNNNNKKQINRSRPKEKKEKNTLYYF